MTNWTLDVAGTRTPFAAVMAAALVCHRRNTSFAVLL
jgi:hypothetical protein